MLAGKAHGYRAGAGRIKVFLEFVLQQERGCFFGEEAEALRRGRDDRSESGPLSSSTADGPDSRRGRRSSGPSSEGSQRVTDK